MSNEIPQTHAVTTPNKRPATPIEVLRANLSGQVFDDITANFGNPKDAAAFKVAAIDYVRRMPKLLECNRISLLSAFVNLAQFRFMPMGVNGQGYIIPYGSEAKFQIGYQGYVDLFYRAGVKSVKALVVYSNEHFRYEEGLETLLEHTPTKFGEKKGDPVGVYAVAVTPTGGKVFKVMSRDEVMAIKNMSKAKDKKDSPWNSGDPEMWMWKKTCLIQLAKLLPKSIEIQRAIELDYEGEGADRPTLDAGGPAVGRASHAPEPIREPSENHPSVSDSDTKDAQVTELSGKKCAAGKHPIEHTDKDGDCKDCVAEALDQTPPADGEPTIQV